jgi:hypothetical protein
MVRVDLRCFWAQVKSKLGEPINVQSWTDKAHREMSEFTCQIDMTENLIYKSSARTSPPSPQKGGGTCSVSAFDNLKPDVDMVMPYRQSQDT